jgi:hypothetical protein
MSFKVVPNSCLASHTSFSNASGNVYKEKLLKLWFFLVQYVSLYHFEYIIFQGFAAKFKKNEKLKLVL